MMLRYFFPRHNLLMIISLMLTLVLGLCYVPTGRAFSLSAAPTTLLTTTPMMMMMKATTQHDDDCHNNSAEAVDAILSRRKVLQAPGSTAAALLVLLSSGSSAEASSSEPIICVIGANGRTGSECVRACVDRNIPVRATSRSGVFNGGESSNNNIQPLVCDVTLPETIGPVVQGARGVVFAASASKEGGSPAQVDNNGLVNVARACLAAKVPHLVVVSSGAVTKPNSPVYQFLNLFGGIMAEKIQGEDVVRKLYKEAGDDLAYTIIRPGGLTEEPGKGVAALELNQGDNKSGRISRSDVASLCIEAINYSSLTNRATFECYDADTGKALSTVGISNILKQTSDSSDFISGKERRGNSFQQIFTGLERDG